MKFADVNNVALSGIVQHYIIQHVLFLHCAQSSVIP